MVHVSASMRPRVFPAEDGEADGPRHDPVGASMRPRVFPAEDATFDVPTGSMLPAGFNEAAGIPRGRPEAWRSGCPAATWRFNEAAGIPRGRRTRPPAMAPTPCSLQ